MEEHQPVPVCIFCNSDYRTQQSDDPRVSYNPNIWIHSGECCKYGVTHCLYTICPYCFSSMYVGSNKGNQFKFCSNPNCMLYEIKLITPEYLKVYYNKLILFNCKLKEEIKLYFRKKFSINFFGMRVYTDLFFETVRIE